MAPVTPIEWHDDNSQSGECPYCGEHVTIRPRVNLRYIEFGSANCPSCSRRLWTAITDDVEWWTTEEVYADEGLPPVDLKAIPDPQSAEMAVALWRAVRHGQVHRLRALLDAGADVSMVGPGGVSVMHQAVNRRQKLSALALIEYGADVNELDAAGQTPLSRAIELDYTEVADLLRDFDAKTPAELMDTASDGEAG